MVTKSIWTKAVTVLSVSLLSLAQTLPVLALEETSSLGSGAPANSTTASSFSSDAVLPVTSSSVLEGNINRRGSKFLGGSYRAGYYSSRRRGDTSEKCSSTDCRLSH